MRFIRDLSTALALVILTMLLAMVRMSWHAYGRVAAEAGRADRPGPTEAAERMRPNILVNGVVEQYERPGGPTVMGELRVDQAQRLLPVLSAIRGYLRGDLTQGPLIERNFDVFTAFQFDEYMQSWYAAQRAPDDPEALYAKFEHIVRATCLTGVRANQETPRQTGEGGWPGVGRAMRPAWSSRRRLRTLPGVPAWRPRRPHRPRRPARDRPARDSHGTAA